MCKLISIIIPVYNVENYLVNCIKSISNQSYKNLEIILIDDGSTDNSPIICDQFKKSDNRIKVLHKTNGGLSDARNIGLEISSGDYVVFVDSDDFLPNYAIEYLYRLMIANEADISVGSMVITEKSEIFDDSNQVNYEDKLYKNNIRILSVNEALSEMFYSRFFSTAAPAKMFKKKLFQGVKFPLGKLHEDLFTIYKVIQRANKIVYGSEVVYYYYRRIGSITKSKFTANRLDILEALNYIERDVDIKRLGLERAYATQVIDSIFSVLQTDITVNDIRKNGLWDLVIEYRSKVLTDSKCPLRVRGYCYLSYLGLWCTKQMLQIYYGYKWRFHINEN